jgi:hypothetical protein
MELPVSASDAGVGKARKAAQLPLSSVGQLEIDAAESKVIEHHIAVRQQIAERTGISRPTARGQSQE